MGMIMFITGIVGLVCCIILLFFLPRIFEKQKKKLLQQIEREE